MDISKFRINGARVLVKEEKLSAELSSGIIMPGREKQQTNKGKVLIVGDGEDSVNTTECLEKLFIKEDNPKWNKLDNN